MMTRDEFENNLMARLEDIKALYKEYNPEAFNPGNKLYLTMVMTNDGISANNSYFNISETNPDCQRVVNVFKRGDGDVTHRI